MIRNRPLAQLVCDVSFLTLVDGECPRRVHHPLKHVVEIRHIKEWVSPPAYPFRQPLMPLDTTIN